MKAWILSSQTQGDWASSSTEVLVRSAKQLAIDVEVINPEHLHFTFSHSERFLYREGKKLSDIDYPDLVLPRLGWSSLKQGLRVCDILESIFCFRVINSTGSIGLCSDKMKQLLVFSKENIPFVETHWASPSLSTRFHFVKNNFEQSDADKVSSLKSVHENSNAYVIKTLQGSQGFGVTFHPDEFSAKAQIDCLRTLEADFILQNFIPCSKPVHDIRIFVIDRKPVAAMKRFAKEGEFRSNLHQGGHAEKIALNHLDPSLISIAEKAASGLGLYYGAVDFIQSESDMQKYFVLEVNAFPGLVGISNTTNVDIANEIWKSLRNKSKP